MFYIIHTLLGILIGNSISSITLVILLALISHFILDAIPHWDTLYKGKVNLSKKLKIKPRVLVLELADGIISLFLIVFFYLKFNNFLIILGAFASLLPDILKLGFFTKFKKNKLFLAYLKFHHNIQKEINPPLGLLIQLFIAIILLLLIN